jgi:hypothetical protein
LIQKKGSEFSNLGGLLGSSRDSALQQVAQLQGRLDDRGGGLQASETTQKQGIRARGILEEEIDELS